MIAVGSDDPNPAGGGKVQIFEFRDSERYVDNVCIDLKCQKNEINSYELRIQNESPRCSILYCKPEYTVSKHPLASGYF